jgi:hypothetical protein
MEREVINYGLTLKPIEKDQWVVGSKKATARFGAGEVKPDGDWTKYDPERELQRKNGYETNGCVLFATGNALLALARFLKFDFPNSSSERYLGVMCRTNSVGTDPHFAAETIRFSSGIIPDNVLPWTDQRDFSHFYAPNPMYPEYIKLGQKTLRKYDLHHEWVWNGEKDPVKKRELLKAALKRGTVCVSVRAWEQQGTLYTKEKGAPDTHWVWLTKYEGDTPIIRDQYYPFVKRLAPMYDFNVAKVYFMSPNTTGMAPCERDLITRLLNQIRESLIRIALKLNEKAGVLQSGIWKS